MQRTVFLTIFFLSIVYVSKAQVTYSISGIVKEKTGEILPGATIFLDGSEKKTYSNDKGNYNLSKLAPGTYELTIHFVGYKSYRQNVIIQDQSLTVHVVLDPLETTLKEVVITNSVSKNKYMQMFTKSFIGDTENGLSCTILNPEIIRFSEEQTIYVVAKTNDFLEIENKNLGYRIKYLLRDFRLNRASLVASFTGECIFENLKGTKEEAIIWDENRKIAYYGSLMHYLRSLYNNSAEMDGFFFYSVKNAKSASPKIDTRRLLTKDISTAQDSNFLAISFPQPLFVFYNNANDIANLTLPDESKITEALKKQVGSTIELHLDKAVVDTKGSLVDYRSFLIKGYWGVRRIGDQLPFEYSP